MSPDHEFPSQPPPPPRSSPPPPPAPATPPTSHSAQSTLPLRGGDSAPLDTTVHFRGGVQPASQGRGGSPPHRSNAPSVPPTLRSSLRNTFAFFILIFFSTNVFDHHHDHDHGYDHDREHYHNHDHDHDHDVIDNVNLQCPLQCS